MKDPSSLGLVWLLIIELDLKDASNSVVRASEIDLDWLWFAVVLFRVSEEADLLIDEHLLIPDVQTFVNELNWTLESVELALVPSNLEDGQVMAGIAVRITIEVARVNPDASISVVLGLVGFPIDLERHHEVFVVGFGS